MSKDVFKALLLIYASYTDLEFSSVEKDEIVNLLGHKNFHSANQLYSNFREYELLKNICNFRQLYYPGNEGKDQVLGMVKTHFMADGDFSKLERTQYDFLRMML
ncbi:MAG: hypothetical protein V3V00_14805 [Saprospiraceae bacterium]